MQLVVSGPEVGKVAEPLTLTCTVSGASIADGRYCWHWVRQHLGRQPECLGWIYPYEGNKTFVPVYGRSLTIYSDSFKNQFYLQLYSLAVADTAIYYCTQNYKGLDDAELTVTQAHRGL